MGVNIESETQTQTKGLKMSVATKKYRAQFSKAQQNSNGSLSPIRGLNSKTIYVTVEASGLTDANEKAEKEVLEKHGRLWLQDGHAQEIKNYTASVRIG